MPRPKIGQGCVFRRNGFATRQLRPSNGMVPALQTTFSDDFCPPRLVPCDATAKKSHNAVTTCWLLGSGDNASEEHPQHSAWEIAMLKLIQKLTGKRAGRNNCFLPSLESL